MFKINITKSALHGWKYVFSLKIIFLIILYYFEDILVFMLKVIISNKIIDWVQVFMVLKVETKQVSSLYKSSVLG